MSWQFVEAKHNLGDVITRAFEEGPQRIYWRGQAVVLVAEAEYRRLTRGETKFKDHLLNGPDLSDLDLARDPSPMREIPL